MISLDPGVRPFMTGYDPSGTAVEWGKNEFTDYVMHMTNSKARVIKFMKKKNATGKFC